MEEKKDYTFGYNRLLYGLFVLLMLYHIFFRKEYLDGASTLGIALIFDPFDAKVVWGNRPMWQRLWLIMHLLVLITCFVLGIFFR